MLSISNIRRTPSLVPSEPYDCCLFASGYEERATAVARTVVEASSRTVVWAFKDHLQAGHRVANDEYLRRFDPGTRSRRLRSRDPQP